MIEKREPVGTKPVDSKKEKKKKREDRRGGATGGRRQTLLLHLSTVLFSFKFKKYIKNEV